MRIITYLQVAHLTLVWAAGGVDDARKKYLLTYIYSSQNVLELFLVKGFLVN
jgi:hypothetical protein